MTGGAVVVLCCHRCRRILAEVDTDPSGDVVAVPPCPQHHRGRPSVRSLARRQARGGRPTVVVRVEVAADGVRAGLVEARRRGRPYWLPVHPDGGPER